MTTDIVDVKAALTESLTELHLPTVRRTYEEALVWRSAKP
jgi:hypothetical protein